MLQMTSEKGLSGQVLADADLDNKDLANTTSQTTRTAEIIDASDVVRADIEYGSFVSSSEGSEEPPEDHIETVAAQSSVIEEERTATYNDNINNGYGINSEKASNDTNGRLLMAMELDSIRENRVLRKLLQAPRYFDYPESNWLGCNEFSEDDGKNNKGNAKRQHKSCYICGDINHPGNRCKKVNFCTFCSVTGHLVINCPNKNDEPACASTLCLKCGNTDHDILSCTNDYDPEDLKVIECYICKELGHLCCAENKAVGATEASCYHCGQSGHFGFECTKSNKVMFEPHLLCRICNERGHTRKQCPKKTKMKLKWRKYWIARRRKISMQTQTDCSTSNSRPVAAPISSSPTYTRHN